MNTLISLNGISKIYNPGTSPVHALQDVDLEVAENEYVAIMGSSGSGKSTLMNIIGCLDVPTEGRYILAGKEVEQMSDDDLAAIRNREIGFVFQMFNLLPRSSALTNVELPLIYAGVGKKERREHSIEALGRVGLGERTHHLPNQLSGGEQQRVAIARALVTEPSIILADEPTGNLDSRASEEIMEIFEGLNAEGKSIVMVTHEEDIGHHARRIVRLKDGRIIEDEHL